MVFLDELKNIIGWLKKQVLEALGDVAYSWLKVVIHFLAMGFLIGAIGLLLIMIGVKETPKYMDTPYKIGGRWISDPATGVDAQKKFASFVFLRLSDRFYWEKGSTEKIVDRGKVLKSEDFQSIVKNDLFELMKRCGGLIAVGTSSQEGDQVNEEARALRRAATLAEWLKPLIPAKKGLYKLSLGQYEKSCSDCESSRTFRQRTAIIICIKNWQADVNMGQAVAHAMSQLRDLPNTADYSQFFIKKLRGMPFPPSKIYLALQSLRKDITIFFERIL